MRFFRPLGVGDRGDDVLQLKRILAAAGDNPGRDGHGVHGADAIRARAMAGAASLSGCDAGLAAVGHGLPRAGFRLHARQADGGRADHRGRGARTHRGGNVGRHQLRSAHGTPLAGDAYWPRPCSGSSRRTPSCRRERRRRSSSPRRSRVPPTSPSTSLRGGTANANDIVTPPNLGHAADEHDLGVGVGPHTSRSGREAEEDAHTLARHPEPATRSARPTRRRRRSPTTTCRRCTSTAAGRSRPAARPARRHRRPGAVARHAGQRDARGRRGSRYRLRAGESRC